jgi:hypothetical protein
MQVLKNNLAKDDIIINQVHSVKGFQNTTFAPQFKTVEQKWIANTIFTDIMPKCTQIHHTGQDHWVTSVQTETNETYILDNLLEKLTVSQEIQLSHIYSYHVLVESGLAHDLCFHVLHVLNPFVHSHPTIFCMPSVSPQSQFVSIMIYSHGKKRLLVKCQKYINRQILLIVVYMQLQML